VPGIQVLDDYTIQFTLNAPDRLFLVDGMIGIASPEAYQTLGADFNRIPVGTGPYQFEAWVAGEYIQIRPNPNYFDSSLPRNDGVIYRLYADENAILADYRADDVDL